MTPQRKLQHQEIQLEFEEERELPTGVPQRSEIQLLLQTAQQNPRDQLMISLLYSAGLRRQELLALRRAQIDFQQGTAFLDACKGDKDRVVLFDPHTLAQLDRYSAAMAPHQRIFPLSEYWGDNNFKRWAEESGLYQQYQQKGLRISTHSMRHAFATHHYEQGMDFQSVLWLLGHTFEETTTVYLRTAQRQLPQAYLQSHPLAKLEGSDSVAQANAPQQPPSPDPAPSPAPGPGPQYPEYAEVLREFEQQPQASRMGGLPLVPTPAEILQILQSTGGPTGLLLRLLYASGLWIQDALQLHSDQLTTHGLQTPNGLHPLDPITLAHLQQLPQGKLFDLDPQTVENAWLDHAQRSPIGLKFAALQRPLSLATLRYAFACHCAQGGIDSISLMRLLGHQYITCTQNYYIRSASTRLRKLFDATSQGQQS